jgi:hypothetical protein
MVSIGAATTQDSDGDGGPLQLVIDQVEELVVTLIEELRERPGIAAALVAGVIGAMIGSWLATRGRPRATHGAGRQVARRGRKASNTAKAASTGLHLLQNPVVRGLIIAVVQRQLKNRLTPSK